MASLEQIKEVIFSAIDEVNEQLPQDQRVPKAKNTILMGGKDGLDSLALVNLIVTLEGKIEDKFGVSLALIDSSLFAQKSNPLKTIGSLIDHIQGLLEQKSHENQN